VFTFTSALGIASAQHHTSSKATQAFAAKVALATPSSIQEEHKHLRHELDAALASGGKTAGAAKMVERLLLPHFQAEEAYAMPPLGLLEAIAHNRSLSGEQVQQAIKMADQLGTNYEQMVQEHQQLHAALEALASAAREEHKSEAISFAEGLMLHAENEEQILYPTTILIGKYFKLKQAAGK